MDRSDQCGSPLTGTDRGEVRAGAGRRGVFAVREVVAQVRTFAGEGPPVLLGVPGRFWFVGASGHATDRSLYPARGDTVKNSRIGIDMYPAAATVEVHTPSANNDAMARVTAGYGRPRSAMEYREKEQGRCTSQDRPGNSCPVPTRGVWRLRRLPENLRRFTMPDGVP